TRRWCRPPPASSRGRPRPRGWRWSRCGTWLRGCRAASPPTRPGRVSVWWSSVAPVHVEEADPEVGVTALHEVTVGLLRQVQGAAVLCGVQAEPGVVGAAGRAAGDAAHAAQRLVGLALREQDRVLVGVVHRLPEPDLAVLVDV